MTDSVLFVESSDLLRNITSRTLAQMGYFVRPYDSEETVIADMEADIPYKIAFVDLQLPNNGGYKVIEVSKRINPTIPVYSISSVHLYQPERLESLVAGHLWRGDATLDKLTSIINSILK